MWDDIQDWYSGASDDLKSWWDNLDERKKKFVADAIIGQAGVEGNQALRETTPSTEEIATDPDTYAYRGGEILAGLPDPTPLESKAQYMGQTGGYKAAVAEMQAKDQEVEKEDKTTSDLEKLFLYSMLENMQGGDIGQAPAVVAGGGRREFPTMMRQSAPWEREKPYWWMR
tara:strand:- start:538 stop:1050 length:513 start_codon:yes stop_codon:yes gene_type:complete